MKRRQIINVALALFGLASIVCNAVAQEACKLTAIGAANIATVRGGRTLMLDDGRELRLAAIEVSPDSRDALQSLIGGRTLRLERVGTELDRYGRLVAFAYVGDAQQSLQQALLSQGLARVSARIGGKACADALLTTERTARAARQGLWADPNFAPLQAENLTRVTAEQGISRWSKARSCRCAKVGPLYMSTSGGAGRVISRSSLFLNASRGYLPRRVSSRNSSKAAASACADGSNSAAARSYWPRRPSRSNSRIREVW
jgi:endonuclease YncB( thermonuclease family)